MYGNYIYTYPSMMAPPIFQSPGLFQTAPAMGMGMRGIGSMGSGGLGAMRNAGFNAMGNAGLGRMASGGLGGASKLGGILSGIKKFNWGSLLNNASKTLGVVNQAIPVVREFGPMMNNMRSMIKVASVFKDETDNSPRKNSKEKKEENINQTVSTNDSTDASDDKSSNYIKTENNSNSNEPNFFL